jgi:hypothetical protein
MTMPSRPKPTLAMGGGRGGPGVGGPIPIASNSSAVGGSGTNQMLKTAMRPKKQTSLTSEMSYGGPSANKGKGGPGGPKIGFKAGPSPGRPFKAFIPLTPQVTSDLPSMIRQSATKLQLPAGGLPMHKGAGLPGARIGFDTGRPELAPFAAPPKTSVGGFSGGGGGGSVSSSGRSSSSSSAAPFGSFASFNGGSSAGDSGVLGEEEYDSSRSRAYSATSLVSRADFAVDSAGGGGSGRNGSVNLAAAAAAARNGLQRNMGSRGTSSLSIGNGGASYAAVARCAFSADIYTRGCHWFPRLLA